MKVRYRTNNEWGYRPAPGHMFENGDWSCGNCGDHQFRKSRSCRKCHANREQSRTQEYMNGKFGYMDNVNQMNDEDYAYHSAGGVLQLSGGATSQGERSGVRNADIGSLSGREATDRDPRYVTVGY